MYRRGIDMYRCGSDMYRCGSYMCRCGSYMYRCGKMKFNKINKIIPHRINIVTLIVCHPWKVFSRITSRHYLNKIKINIKNLHKNKFVEK